MVGRACGLVNQVVVAHRMHTRCTGARADTDQQLRVFPANAQAAQAFLRNIFLRLKDEQAATEKPLKVCCESVCSLCSEPKPA